MLSIGFSAMLIAMPLQQPPAANAAGACDVATANDIGAVVNILSMRLVDIVRRSRADGWEQDDKLKALIAPSAEFDLGAGDVGRPMGTGIAGARKMVAAMPASSFRYTSWASIPMPADGCAEHQVTVEFFDASTGDVARIEGRFRAGTLISAKGWMQGEVSGKL